ncbi:2-deoxy-scyllo-inosose synthase [Paenibacillus sp. P36]|uniref:2-deoxy-scyllo-inosose synthase n=1 Tax=Paenibacillus sp. P36 TaxID=3342538 RepID=UPI0038B348EB
MLTTNGGLTIYKKQIQFGTHQYDFISGEGILGQVTEWLNPFEVDKYMIISDSGVPHPIVAQTMAAFEKAGTTYLLTFPPGEKNKNLITIENLCRKALALGADRRTVIVALGGGVSGNVAGMVAGMLCRGLPLIHIPTTLIAASDSVLSLKQGVNLDQGKNILGFFYTPRVVCVELSFLHSLPAREIRSGLCELVKNLLAILPEQIDTYRKLLRPSSTYRMEELQQFIEFCIEAKMTVMQDDPYEKNHAVVLEYGHTIGHAVELLGNGDYSHGESIAFGMLCMSTVSKWLGLLTENEVDLHHELLELIGANVIPPSSWIPDIEKYMLRDNKKGYRRYVPGKTGLVLLNGLGRIHQEAGSFITYVDDDLVRESIRYHTESKIYIKG